MVIGLCGIKNIMFLEGDNDVYRYKRRPNKSKWLWPT